MNRVTSQDRVRNSSCLGRLGPLVQGFTAQWPRRGHALLEIGCGDGEALELMWAFGFDVTGLEKDPQEVEQARQRFCGRADVHLGAYDAMPFDDGYFDYVMLFTVFECLDPSETEIVLTEALRLASKSVLCIFPSTWSTAWLASRLPGRVREYLCGGYVLCNGHNPLTILRKLRRNGGRRWLMRSILPGPGATWSAKTAYGKYINSRLLPGPFGSYVGIRLDLVPPVGLTGLPLRVKKPCLSMSRSSALTTRNATRVLTHEPKRRCPL